MHYSITKYDDPFHIRVTPSGEASWIRFQWMFTEIASIVAGFDRPPILLDERSSTLGHIDTWDFMKAYDFLLEKNDVLAHTKLAILANPGPDLDVAHRFKQLAQTGSHAAIEVFDTEETAINWLRSPATTWVNALLPLVAPLTFLLAYS